MTSMTTNNIFKQVKHRKLLGLSHEVLESLSETEHFSLDNKNCAVYLPFARLTVGWAWQELFSSMIGAMIPDGDNQRATLLAFSNSLFALFVFFMGAKMELIRQKIVSDAQNRVHSVESNLAPSL